MTLSQVQSDSDGQTWVAVSIVFTHKVLHNNTDASDAEQTQNKKLSCREQTVQKFSETENSTVLLSYFHIHNNYP